MITLLCTILAYLLTHLIEIIIAIFLTYIAYKQYKLEQNKYKLDSFDKRYEIYNTVRENLYKISARGWI